MWQMKEVGQYVLHDSLYSFAVYDMTPLCHVYDQWTGIHQFEMQRSCLGDSWWSYRIIEIVGAIATTMLPLNLQNNFNFRWPFAGDHLWKSEQIRHWYWGSFGDTKSLMSPCHQKNMQASHMLEGFMLILVAAIAIVTPRSVLADVAVEEKQGLFHHVPSGRMNFFLSFSSPGPTKQFQKVSPEPGSCECTKGWPLICKILEAFRQKNFHSVTEFLPCVCVLVKPGARKQCCAQCVVLQVQTQNPGELVELTRRKVCSHENAVFSANLLQVAEQLLRQLEIGTCCVPHTTKVSIWKFASQGQYEGVEATVEEVPFKGVDQATANRFWFCWVYSLCWQDDFLLGFPQAILDGNAAAAHQAVHKFNTTANSGCNACLPAIPFAATFEWPIAQKGKSAAWTKRKKIGVTAQIQIVIGTHALCQWHYTVLYKLNNFGTFTKQTWGKAASSKSETKAPFSEVFITAFHRTII